MRNSNQILYDDQKRCEENKIFTGSTTNADARSVCDILVLSDARETPNGSVGELRSSSAVFFGSGNVSVLLMNILNCELHLVTLI